MAYTKTVWVNGSNPFTPASPSDPKINAANLNKIENELEYLDGSLSSTIKNAIVGLFEKCAYIDTDPSIASNIAILESWAEEVNSITLSSSTLTFSGSGSQTLTATVDPVGSTVTWNSSDTSVATVSGGVVTSVGNGSCTITASAGGLSATCSVTVSGIVTLESISAVYTQSGTVYDTDSLDALKADLVVTATYSDSSTATIASADYTLSGTLTAGTSTITVEYSGETTTFTVTVTAEWDVTWSYTSGELPSADEWTFAVNGSTTSYQFAENGLILTSGKAADTIGAWRPASLSNYAVGVAEYTFEATTNSTNTYVSIGDRTSVSLLLRCIYSSNYKGIYLANASQPDGMTKLAGMAMNTEYTVRLVINNTVGDVYLNGTLLASNINLSTVVHSSHSTAFYISASGTVANQHVLLKSIKLKLNRLV